MKTKREVSMRVIAAIVLLALMVVWVVPAAANGQNGTTLSDTVTAAPHWQIRYNWTIDKAVTPALWNLFKGDTGTSQYTITVTKDAGTESAWVDGEVCVTNGGAVATENLAILAVLQNGYGSPNDFLTSAPVDLSAKPVLGPGETYCYPYRVNIPITGGAFPQPHAGGTYKVTPDVTITNHSGHLGEPFGPNEKADLVMLSSPTLINNSINVDDTNGGSWAFSAGGSVSYSKTFACDADEGTLNNTATIRGTEQSASASVTVNCYDLFVRKDAKTSLTRTYKWKIDKQVNPTALTLSIGQQMLVNYTVVAQLDTPASVDSDWAVAGTIRVRNPAPIAATINGVADVISGIGPVTVNCPGVSFPYALPANDYMDCTYTQALPNADGRTNIATATLQNYDYDKDLNATAHGTTDFSSLAVAVSFANPTVTEKDTCIAVSDTYAGALGTVCRADSPKTFNYSRWIGPFVVCGTYTVDNTASFVTNDTKTTGEDGASVAVTVPCGGCTLTQGYWKTHSKYGPAPYDDTWARKNEDTVFFLSGQTWYEVLWTAPSGGNAYYILAHQYIAAVMNGLNGAGTTPAVTDALSWATVFFGSKTPTTKLSKTERQTVISYATILDNYNNGLIGPGHCSE